jgi:hypothetical protein
MPIQNAAAGITALSQLQIDADKVWNLKGISNLKELALGMVQGDILVHDGTRIIRLAAGNPNYVLTSDGPGLMVKWGPPGLYFNRFYPVTISQSLSVVKKPPDRTFSKAAPIASPYVDVLGDAPGSYVKMLSPAITRTLAAVIETADKSKSINAPVSRLYELQIPVGGAVADDGGVLTDETAAAVSEITRYANYIAGEDGDKTCTATAWEAQTFTPATTHNIRAVWLKLVGAAVGTVTLSVRATAAGLPTGADLATATLVGVIADPSARWYKFTFAAPTTLTAAVVYALVLRNTSGTGTLKWRADLTAPAYAGGQRCFSTNSGVNWTADATADFMFEEWGTALPADMHFFPAAIAVGDAYYFGHSKKFDVLVVDINTPGAGTYTAVWEYSQGAGAWAALVGLADGTNAFKNQWTREVTHTPQAGWALDTVSGINAYWVRARCDNAGAGYTQPLGNFAQVRIIT